MPSSKSFPQVRKVSRTTRAIRDRAPARTTNHPLRIIHCRRERSDQRNPVRIWLWQANAETSLLSCNWRGQAHPRPHRHDVVERIDRSLLFAAKRRRTPPPHTRRRLKTEHSHFEVLQLI